MVQGRERGDIHDEMIYEPSTPPTCSYIGAIVGNNPLHGLYPTHQLSQITRGA
jgi:hypothetical protein